MAPPRRGETFTCIICGNTFYRSPSQIAAGSTRTCSKACMGKSFSGDKNPYYGRNHSKETREKLSLSHKGKGIGNQYAKGTIHTTQQKEARSERSKRMWAEQREKMMASLPRGEDHYTHRTSPKNRHQPQLFSKSQRNRWKDDTCLWCGSTEDLELDHIVPVFMGGQRVKENAQTLCKTCNRWKHHFIEVPMWHALRNIQAAFLDHPPNLISV